MVYLIDDYQLHAGPDLSSLPPQYAEAGRQAGDTSRLRYGMSHWRLPRQVRTRGRTGPRAGASWSLHLERKMV